MADERNYHVFYEMLAGLNGKQKDDMGLQSADKYFYLNQVKTQQDFPKKLKILLSIPISLMNQPFMWLIVIIFKNFCSLRIF